MDETVTAMAITYITDLFRGRSDGHEAEHTLRVYRNALRIAEEDAGAREVDFKRRIEDAFEHPRIGRRPRLELHRLHRSGLHVFQRLADNTRLGR